MDTTPSQTITTSSHHARGRFGTWLGFGLCAVLVLTGSQAAWAKAKARRFDRLPKAPVLKTLDDDVRFGREYWAKMAAGMQQSGVTLDDDESELNILRGIVGRIATANHAPLSFEVHLTGEEGANAYALPGGVVGVQKGLWNRKSPFHVRRGDTDELAFVLAHEMAHAVERHVAERLVHDVSRREQESEADHEGLLYMAKAGFDPRAAVRLWRRTAKLLHYQKVGATQHHLRRFRTHRPEHWKYVAEIEKSRNRNTRPARQWSAWQLQRRVAVKASPRCGCGVVARAVAVKRTWARQWNSRHTLAHRDLQPSTRALYRRYFHPSARERMLAAKKLLPEAMALYRAAQTVE